MDESGLNFVKDIDLHSSRHSRLKALGPRQTLFSSYDLKTGNEASLYVSSLFPAKIVILKLFSNNFFIQPVASCFLPRFRSFRQHIFACLISLYLVSTLALIDGNLVNWKRFVVIFSYFQHLALEFAKFVASSVSRMLIGMVTFCSSVDTDCCSKILQWYVCIQWVCKSADPFGFNNEIRRLKSH